MATTGIGAASAAAALGCGCRQAVDGTDTAGHGSAFGALPFVDVEAIFTFTALRVGGRRAGDTGDTGNAIQYGGARGTLACRGVVARVAYAVYETAGALRGIGVGRASSQADSSGAVRAARTDRASSLTRLKIARPTGIRAAV